ncbi:uncharacterized protein LOC124159221 [Ischnura elegans]|uniref:uncharacterized protein LOC124159221 n=1 Tax=Ischnura elegans TaxID=197161 RepID=UPI001ED884B9|nr:uncharacterized protein LOC124159221 [Ischnura elegans]
MDAVPVETRKDPAITRGTGMSLRTSLALLLAAATFVFLAAYTYGFSSFAAKSEGPSCPAESKEAKKEGKDYALASPKGEEEEEPDERLSGAGASTPGSTTGQRVAGHLLAVLLLASVTAAIVEAVRARMTRTTATKAPEAAAPGVAEVHHHGSNPGCRVSRRGTFQEKSYSYDGYIYRSRSSSAGVSNQQEGVPASSAASATRSQKAMRFRLAGKTGATPPLLRRSSFPVMSRTLSRGDSNGGSPATGSRKPSISDAGDDELGDLQKKRVRLIRRF